jgi:plasmid stabilization system protein ParE
MGDLVTTQRDGQGHYLPGHTTPGPGRDTLYSDAIAQVICDKIAKGVTRAAAAEAAGISRETLQDWMRERDAFAYLVARADAEAEIAYSEALFAAATDTANAKGDGKMAVEWLKRRRRADYGDTLDVRKLDDDTILRMLHASQQQDAAITEDGQPAIVSGADDI